MKILLLLLFTIWVNCDWYEDLSSTEINNENYQQYIGSSKCVIVGFLTKWCRYSKQLAPVWQELTDAYDGTDAIHKDDVLIGKMDCDAAIETCEKYEIPGYPTIMGFQPGDLQGKIIDVTETLDGFSNWINENCKNLQKD